MDTNATHEQARLQLELFEMRREARLRQAREWVQNNYFIESFEDAMRIGAPGTEAGTNVMMVAGYWEQACAMLNHGLLHEDLFFSTTGEFFMTWERMKPMVAGFRKQFANPHVFEHIEKAAARFEEWSEKRAPGHVARMREFMKTMRPAGTKAA
ncbi:MAG TPA: hypothetical protein VMI10_11490 [Terriglobales bacterium]|nr:hypothetical protein [Terriglobales bacterium]